MVLNLMGKRLLLKLVWWFSAEFGNLRLVDRQQWPLVPVASAEFVNLRLVGR